MAIAFDNILVPVDFSVNTEIAIKRAAAMAGSTEPVLHLLHVIRAGKQPKHLFARWSAERELDLLCKAIEEKHPSIKVRFQTLKGPRPQEMIIKAAAMIKPDMIVIGKRDVPRRWAFLGGVSPDIIAKRSGCPVLTIKPGSLDSKTRIILMPIRDFIPERKLEWAVLLAQKYRAQVHLLAIRDRSAMKELALPETFLKVYHHLRERLRHPIEYSATGRHNTAKAALACAELIRADMILLNPGTESGMSGLTGYRHISDLLKRDSRIQVLDVEPYKTN